MFTAAAQKSTPLSLTVVGVASDASLPRGATGGLAPYRLVTSQWDSLARANGWKGGEFRSVTLLADSNATVDGVRDRVQAMGFQAETTGDLLRGIGELLGRLRVALLGLSVVALLLACLGIANTMYTAVLERTREIGILKAVGARSRDVMLIFVAEAAVLGLAGGVLGAVAGALLARAGNSAVDNLVPAVARGSFEVFRPDLVAGLLALGVAVVLSMGSGLLPAMRAAAQEPMKALHHE
jgi:putative ABC transport system permease protein